MENNSVFRNLQVSVAALSFVLGATLLLTTNIAIAQNVSSASLLLEEIVVTSRRREERLLDQPMSIAAMTGEQMQVQGILSIDDMSDYVPNLTLTSSNRANQNRVVIRGIGGGHPDPVFVFGSGMYIDGHYVPNSLGGYASTLDIERVEVLRGPQGTLFGKNVVGGAVNIISTKPDEEFDASIRLRAGEDGEQNVRGMVNIPISDNIYARISASSEEFDGYYYNQNLDIDSGFTDTKAIRGAIRFEPSDQLTFDAAISSVKKRDDNLGGQCIGQGALNDAPQWGGGTGNLERRLFVGATQALFDICDADMAAGDFVHSSDRATFANVDEMSATIGMEWNSDGAFGSLDDATIKLKASYRNMEYTYLADRDYTSLPIDHIGTVDSGQHNETRGFEALFEGQVSDNLRFTLGYNYFQEDALNGNDVCNREFAASGGINDPSVEFECSDFGGLAFELVPNYFDPAGTGQWPNGPRINGGGPGPFAGEVSVYNKSHGVFAHVTYDINDRLTLDLGGRYTSDDRQFSNLEVAIADCVLPITGSDPLCGGNVTVLMNQAGVQDGFFNSAEDTFTAFTPMASLTYNLFPEGSDYLTSGMIYALYSEGFLTGGFNTEVNSNLAGATDFLTYDPEEVKNYELGFKGQFLDGKVNVMADIFYMDYTNLQRQVTIANPEDPANPGFLLFGADADLGLVQNAAAATISGVEFEMRASLWEGGFLSADWSHLVNEYDDYSYPDIANPGQIIDNTDNRIQDLTPEYTFNVAVDHQFQLAGGATLTPRVSAYWQSVYSYGLNNLNIAVGDNTSTSCTQDAYTKWNGRVTYQPANGDWNLAAYGGNLSDERILETCDTQRSVWRTRLERPRNFGLEFTMNFGG
jgi:iron complex outermembrane receptor protein